MDNQQDAVDIADRVQSIVALGDTVFTDNCMRSLKTRLASSKPTPCFTMFARFFLSSHSKRTIA
jgi:hypothetical protein